MQQPGRLVVDTDTVERGPARVLKPGPNGRIRLRFLWLDQVLEFEPRNMNTAPFPIIPGMAVRVLEEPDSLDGAPAARSSAEDRLMGLMDALLGGGEDEGESEKEQEVPEESPEPAGRDGTVEGVEGPESDDGEEGALRMVRVRVDDELVEVGEDRLRPIKPDETDPEWHMLAGWVRPPTELFARWMMREAQERWWEDTDGLPSFAGARIHFLPHQLYAVRRVLFDRTPRFVLADEVGLGKTIEAGLIIQAMAAANPELSVLVIAPGSMTQQWLAELYLRFGGRAFTVPGLREAPDEHELERLEDAGRVLVSGNLLLSHTGVRDVLAARRWDLVVVDEAHHYPPEHELYPLLRLISSRAGGFLALSATPSKREVGGLLGLLSLVSPEVWAPDDEERLTRQFNERRAVWQALAASLELQRRIKETGDKDSAALTALAEHWDELPVDDAHIDALTEALHAGKARPLDELVAYVQEFYRVDQRLVRSRRATITGGLRWAERVPDPLPYEAPDAEVEAVRLVESFAFEAGESDDAAALCVVLLRALTGTPRRLADVLKARQAGIDKTANAEAAERGRFLERLLGQPGPREQAALESEILATVPALPDEAAWLRKAKKAARAWMSAGAAARLEAAAGRVSALLAEAPDAEPKVLVFAEHSDTVDDFVEVLRARGVDAGPYHWRMERNEREQQAQEFQHGGLTALVSDELGGEGRNFDMAAAVVHLDQPWQAARMEQRIGRLDRIRRGADRPVVSIPVLGPGAVEAQIARIHLDIFRVHSASIGGLEFVLPALQRQVVRAAAAGPAALETLLPKLAEQVDTVRKEADEDFLAAHDLSKEALADAQDSVDLLAYFDGEPFAKAVRRWAQVLGIRNKKNDKHDDGAVTYRFTWEDEQLDSLLPGLSAGGTRSFEGSFDRAWALENENMQLFAPGHVLVDALVRSLEVSPNGRFTVFRRELGMKGRGKLYCVVLLSARLDSVRLPEDMPAGLLARAHRRLWPGNHTAVLELDDRSGAVRAVANDVLVDRICDRDWGGHRKEPIIPPSMLNRHFDLPKLHSATRAAMEQSVAAFRSERGELAEAAADELRDDLADEISYLEHLVAEGRGDTAHSRRELELREILIDALTAEHIAADAVAWIYGV